MPIETGYHLISSRWLGRPIDRLKQQEKGPVSAEKSRSSLSSPRVNLGSDFLETRTNSNLFYRSRLRLVEIYLHSGFLAEFTGLTSPNWGSNLRSDVTDVPDRNCSFCLFCRVRNFVVLASVPRVYTNYIICVRVIEQTPLHSLSMQRTRNSVKGSLMYFNGK